VQTANRLNAAKSRVSVTSAACGSYQISGSILDRSFGRLSGVDQPLARLNALASRFICQSPRAICSALKIQLSLDGIPHRTQALAIAAGKLGRSVQGSQHAPELIAAAAKDSDSAHIFLRRCIQLYFTLLMATARPRRHQRCSIRAIFFPS
jgi:hypothetical protein